MTRKIVLSALLAVVPLAAAAMDVTPDPSNLKWGPAPAGLPPGAQVAVVSGDPGGNGPYVIRARMPNGYTVPPHTHPTDENVTVLSGTLHFAMGGTLDTSKGDPVKAGGFFRAEQGMQHYAWADEPTEIQIHGMGPFAIQYVNPADDPRNMSTTTGAAPKNGK
jgi:quercetin dioxygenase-like cupin family protein